MFSCVVEGTRIQCNTTAIMSECHEIGRLSKLSRFSKDRRGELAKERNLSAAKQKDAERSQSRPQSADRTSHLPDSRVEGVTLEECLEIIWVAQGTQKRPCVIFQRLAAMRIRRDVVELP